MKFFKLKDYLSSWSTWVLGLVAVTPVINSNTEVFDFIPDEFKPLVLTLLGIIGLLVRAVKQFSALKLLK